MCVGAERGGATLPIMINVSTRMDSMCRGEYKVKAFRNMILKILPERWHSG